MSKRNISSDLTEGVAAMKGHHEGTLTLRNYKVEPAPIPNVDSKLIRDTRKTLRCSQAVFAREVQVETPLPLGNATDFAIHWDDACGLLGRG